MPFIPFTRKMRARSGSVEACVYRGYESQEEYDFKENVLAPLDEVEVVDGKVVPKKIEYTMMEK